MIDEDLARLRAHRQNINRYRLLLQGRLSDLEREYVERRISEEEAALNDVASKTFPIVLTHPDMPTSEAA